MRAILPRLAIILCGLGCILLGGIFASILPELNAALRPMPRALIGGFDISVYGLIICGACLAGTAFFPQPMPQAPSRNGRTTSGRFASTASDAYLAKLRGRTAYRARLRAFYRAAFFTLAVLVTFASGAAVNAYRVLSADPTDARYGYRAALHAGDYCYAAFGVACHPNTYRTSR